MLSNKNSMINNQELNRELFEKWCNQGQFKFKFDRKDMVDIEDWIHYLQALELKDIEPKSHIYGSPEITIYIRKPFSKKNLLKIRENPNFKHGESSYSVQAKSFDKPKKRAQFYWTQLNYYIPKEYYSEWIEYRNLYLNQISLLKTPKETREFLIGLMSEYEPYTL